MSDFKIPAANDKTWENLQALWGHFKQLKKEERVSEFSCQSVAKKAKDYKLWIFDPEIKAWYTPEEFVALYERYVHGHDKIIQRMQLRDPYEGIEAAYHQMNSLQSRAKAFTLRVLEYYSRQNK